MTFKLNEVDDFENYITNKKQCPCEVWGCYERPIT